MTLRVENLHFAYRFGVPVLSDVSLSIRSGRFTGLFGPNGSGKSTLLRCLNGALRPHAGRVLLDDRPAAELDPHEIARHIAVVAQETPVLPPFSVLELVMLGRYPHGTGWQADSPADLRLARECLARLDLTAMAERPCDQLSGGERQRVIIARTLAQQAPVLLWDEPGSHLDIRHQLELYQLARSLAAEGRTVVMVCHDIVLAPLFLDDCALFHRGRVLATGAPAEVLTSDRLREAFECEVALDWLAPFSVGCRLGTGERADSP